MDLSGLRKVGNAVVAPFPRRADENERSVFKDLLKALVRDSDYARIIVDLTGVSFFSSLDLGMLVFSHQDAKDRGAELVVVCPDPRALQVFKATKMDGVFSIFETVELAAGGREGRTPTG